MRPNDKSGTIPESCIGIEKQIQHVLYVEDRLRQLSTLKHDKLNLKQQLLQTLTPPDVSLGFSEEINSLCREVESLKDNLKRMTSAKERAEREKISIEITQDMCNVSQSRDAKACNDEESLSLFSEHVLFSTFLKYMVFIAIVFFLIGRGGCVTPRGSVEQNPMVPNTPIGGTVYDGNNHQPQSGSDSQGSRNRRIQKDYTTISPNGGVVE